VCVVSSSFPSALEALSTLLIRTTYGGGRNEETFVRTENGEFETRGPLSLSLSLSLLTIETLQGGNCTDRLPSEGGVMVVGGSGNGALH